MIEKTRFGHPLSYTRVGTVPIISLTFKTCTLYTILLGGLVDKKVDWYTICATFIKHQVCVTISSHTISRELEVYKEMADLDLMVDYFEQLPLGESVGRG